MDHLARGGVAQEDRRHPEKVELAVGMYAEVGRGLGDAVGVANACVDVRQDLLELLRHRREERRLRRHVARARAMLVPVKGGAALHDGVLRVGDVVRVGARLNGDATLRVPSTHARRLRPRRHHK